MTPLLHAGDRLTRDEFMARWERMPELKFAELLRGVVYLPERGTLAQGKTRSFLAYWTLMYKIQVGCVEALSCPTWLMLDDVPQPDLVLRVPPELGGQSSNDGDYGSGPPEFVAEVCLSSRSEYIRAKLDVYQRAGVRECLVISVEERRMEWLVLQHERYQSLSPDDEGASRSEVFPGLSLNEPAFWRDRFPA
jgi:hypothetical protein